MMVVIVIIGILATIVAVNVIPLLGQANRTKVQADLSAIEGVLDQYKLNTNHYPTAQEGLAALVPNYVRRLPQDPWGRDYLYVTPGPNGAQFRIASLGADGREGGDGENADITN